MRAAGAWDHPDVAGVGEGDLTGADGRLTQQARAGRGGPGPLVSAIAKDGVRFGVRKVPITIVPGDLTDDEIAALA